MSGALNLAEIMEAIADRVAAGAMDRAYGWPLGTFTIPCFVVGYPDTIDLDVTPTRDRMEIPCWAIFGDQHAKSTRDICSSFLAGLKAALDGAEPGVWASARAKTISLETLTQDDGDAQYLAARFTVDILT